ncbi:hypothetical protein SAMN05216196_108140 [Lutimaribacter pacificus]|uniref:Uncharacterized protein n=1 Tax=Lutimaribacter pacificus TaxID=391948 RepID=A0A1H0LU04_9RHOB|nr:hypothetical protein [Lutimaribacter pacificus]SDO71739.1 hypothetical protein SAMN05216196_108140 [Lutimaribacter pacificus]SHK03195.1 hypothetical protein SAMN05444142_10317 [Lutimaribacter pacificus]
MTALEDRLTILEARIIAHRQLLARLLSTVDATTQDELLYWIAEREVPRDGQEDPGAVLTGMDALPLSIAEEFREIASLVRNRSPHRRRPKAGEE